MFGRPTLGDGISIDKGQVVAMLWRADIGVCNSSLMTVSTHRDRSTNMHVVRHRGSLTQNLTFGNKF